MNLDYDKLRATPVADAPFPHIVVPDFVPADELPGVIADLPAMERGGSFPIDTLTLGPRAQALMTELGGPRFRDTVAAHFGLDLTDAPNMITLRGRSRERDGQIHTDSDDKRVTVLLYLNPDTGNWREQGGSLRLLRGSKDIEDYAAEVPPVNGTLLVFPNGPHTWHGHKRFVGQRYVVQLNYMTTADAALANLRRHRWTALLKKFRLTG